MQATNHHSGIDLTELKAQMVKKLGPEVAKQYFYYLNRFLSLKTTKTEFDKLCFRILGRENIPLHNGFIRSILKNACTAKLPPPQKNDVSNQATKISGKEISKDAYLANGSYTGATQPSSSQGLSNGVDLLPISPRMARTCLRPNGRTFLARQLTNATQLSDFNVILENKDLNHHPSKTSVVRRSSDASSRVSLQAPLGLPFCPNSGSGGWRALPIETSSKCICASSDAYLLDSHALRERMERIAMLHNLEGVSVECANVLNHGLDSYLKGLIRSCIALVGVKSGQELVKCNTNKHMKVVNGVTQGYSYRIQNSGKEYPISLQDFRVAMEMNPRQLGEDWPLLLEKIYTEAFEE